MLFVELTIEMQINGLLAFIHNILAIILAILVFTKAIKGKKGMLYVFALFMLFSAAGYYQIGLNYIYWVFTQGNLFPYEVSVLVGTAGIGIATWAWIYIYFKMLFAKKTKLAVILYGIFVVIFYAYLLFFYSTSLIEILI